MLRNELHTKKAEIEAAAAKYGAKHIDSGDTIQIQGTQDSGDTIRISPTEAEISIVSPESRVYISITFALSEAL